MNIWKSHITTADKEVNMKAIFAVLNTTWAVLQYCSIAVSQYCSIAVSQYRSIVVSQYRSIAVSQNRSIAVSQNRSIAVSQYHSIELYFCFLSHFDVICDLKTFAIQRKWQRWPCDQFFPPFLTFAVCPLPFSTWREEVSYWWKAREKVYYFMLV